MEFDFSQGKVTLVVCPVDIASNVDNVDVINQPEVKYQQII